MIDAVFHRRGGHLIGVEVSGHAGYADLGQDIVCAAVTSAVQLCANGITEVRKAPAQVRVEENTIAIRQRGADSGGEDFLQALRLHLEVLSQQYEDTIAVTVLEV